MPMIRHSKSLIISLLFHVSVLATILVLYKSTYSIENSIDENKICVKLQTISHTEPKKSNTQKLDPPVKKLHKKVSKSLKKIVPNEKKFIKDNKIATEKKVTLQEKVMQPLLPNDGNITKQIQESIVCDNESLEKSKSKENSAQEYIDLHLDLIVLLLQDNLYYPRSARKRGIVGEVIVNFTIYKGGEVGLIKIVSSNSDVLSRAAIKTIEDLSYKFPKSNENLMLSVPIKYSLSN